jgi:hypothetical protein
MPASPLSWIAPAGRVRLPGAPALSGRDVAVAGMFATAQCQKPLPVGACGSYIDTTKPLVRAGKPRHDSSGEMSFPPGAQIPDCWSTGNGRPFLTVVLVKVNDGTFGRY